MLSAVGQVLQCAGVGVGERSLGCCGAPGGTHRQVLEQAQRGIVMKGGLE